jgi:hypothetical protein
MPKPFAVTMCRDFEAESENWLAGRRSPNFAEHLASCARCRHLMADWMSLRIAARELGLDQPEPSASVWQMLDAQLRKEGIISSQSPPVFPPQRWGGTLPQFVWRPIFTAAYAAVLLVAGVLISSEIRHSSHLFSSQGTQVATVIEDSQVPSGETEAFQSWSEPDPEITASLRQNLNVIDNDISLCKKSVRDEPQNELARDYLNDAYQQKAELLATMVERGVSLQ